MSRSGSPGKFVDLAAMSMSGSLTPSVPVQVLLKYNPPKLTIVYHFESKENDQYYHDITFDSRMLENETDEDIVSHLYMSEGYYFNPKVLKRHQVVRLVRKLKDQMNFYGEDKSPERHSIHGNSPSPIRHRGNMDMPLPENMNSSSGKKTKAEKLNQGYGMGANIDGIPMGNRSPPRNNSNSNNSLQASNNGSPNLENHNLNHNNQNSAERFQNGNGTSDILQNNQNSFQQMQQQSAFQRRKNFFERKRFLNYQAHNPMDFQNKTSNESDGSRKSASPALIDNRGASNSPNENVNNNNLNSFPANPYTHEEEVHVGGSRKNKLAPLDRAGAPRAGKRAAASAAHDRVPIDSKQKSTVMNIEDHNNNNQQNLENSDPYGHNQQENQQEFNQMQSNSNSHESQNNEILAQPNGAEPEGATNTDGETEQVSVYMKDNMIMRRIQIEGDDREFLMDPQGQIFDMNGQFIGTANTNELEELQEDSQNQNGAQEVNDGAAGHAEQNQHNDGETEEMMLLDDDDDLLLPDTANNQDAGHVRDGGHREI